MWNLIFCIFIVKLASRMVLHAVPAQLPDLQVDLAQMLELFAALASWSFDLASLRDLAVLLDGASEICRSFLTLLLCDGGIGVLVRRVGEEGRFLIGMGRHHNTGLDMLSEP